MPSGAPAASAEPAECRLRSASMKRKDIGGGVFLELDEEFRSRTQPALDILAPRGLRRLRRARRRVQRRRWVHRQAG